jgi:hypothetical protein
MSSHFFVRRASNPTTSSVLCRQTTQIDHAHQLPISRCAAQTASSTCDGNKERRREKERGSRSSERDILPRGHRKPQHQAARREQGAPNAGMPSQFFMRSASDPTTSSCFAGKPPKSTMFTSSPSRCATQTASPGSTASIGSAGDSVLTRAGVATISRDREPQTEPQKHDTGPVTAVGFASMDVEI